MKKCFAACTAIICTLVAALGSSPTNGQAWPQRPVRVISPFVAGGSTDTAARIVSERLSAVRGQSFLVENRAGASGAIAAEFVARAPADGYTLFFAASPQLSSVPLVQRVNYDPDKDFAPISIVGTDYFVLAVHKSISVKTVKEFVDYVKLRSGQMNYGSSGNGSSTHLTAALFLARAGLQMTHVPYKGGPAAMADLVGGQLQMLFGLALNFVQYSKSDKITLLAVSTETRAPLFPDLPPMAEFYPGFRMSSWNGYLAPAATPKSIIEQLAHDVAQIVREPAIVERLKSIGMDPLGNTPTEFAEFLRRDAPVWRDAVNASGLKLD